MAGGRRGRRPGRGRGQGRTVDQEETRKPVGDQSLVPMGPVEEQMIEALRKVSEVLERVAETQGQVPVVGQGSGEDRALERFQGCNPPRFAGDTEPEVAEEWIGRIGTILDVLGYSEEKRVALAVYQLEGSARAWWNMNQEKWNLALIPRTWANFSVDFKMKYMPTIIHEQRIAAFSQCCQGIRSVAQYEKHFSELAKTVPEMIPTEGRKILRFIQGLDVEIQVIVAATPVNSYAEVVEKALEIENAKLLERNDKGKRKSLTEDRDEILREETSIPKVARESGFEVSKAAGSLGFVVGGAQASGPSGKKSVQFEGR